MNQHITQTEKAYEALKQAILKGDLEDGVFLSESEIMKRYGIGRTPYREACNRLHYEGILEVVPRRGYLVPELSFSAVRDLFEVRLILEGMIAELAAVRGSEADIGKLERLASKHLPRSMSRGDFAELIRLNSEFHLCLAKMTQNWELVRALTNILQKHERLMYIELSSSRFPSQKTQMLHRTVVEALRRRDPVAAREAVIQDISDAQTVTFGRSPWPSAPSAADRQASRRERPRSPVAGGSGSATG